jgi:hypothetical protein
MTATSGRRKVEMKHPGPENDMPQVTSPTSQIIMVEHIRISSERSFEEVRVILDSVLPTLDPGIVAALRSGDLKYE